MGEDNVMTVDAQEWLGRWHAAVAARDVVAITGFLAEDITMGAPPYWTPMQGKEVVSRLLGVIVETIADFTYHREWVDGNELALEFRGHVGDAHLQGMDLITLNGDGYIQNLDVMIRPANALTELMRVVGEKMQAKLAESTD